jgi:hypothetical protein
MGEGTYPSTLARRTDIRRDAAAEVAPRLPSRSSYTVSLRDHFVRARGPVLRFLPWLLPVTAIVGGLRFLDVGTGPIVVYGLYFLLCVVLPGVLLLRALCGSTGSWPEDIGLGAAIGLAYELIGWALFTAIGMEGYLAAWPALVLVVFVTARPLHRYWLIGRPPRVPVAWHWGVAVAITVAVLAGLYLGMAATQVPPNGTVYYPDLLYHLSMVNQAVHNVPPDLPQVSGHALDYHWFANAHMAAGVDVTGLSSELVLLRLWILPVYVVSLLVFAAMARQVSRTWWAGLVAASTLAVGQFADIWPIPAGLGSSPLTFYSPSLVFGTLMAAAAAMFLMDALYRGPAPWRMWFLAVPLLVVAGGAKPTGLPLLLGGLGMAGLCQLIVKRRVPWRSIGIALLVGVTILVTLQTVVGSTAGSKFRLFGIVRSVPGYRESTGDTAMAGGPGWTVPSLTDGDSVAYWGALVVLATIFVAQLSSLSSFAATGHRGTRRDPVAWFLVGAVLAGWLALLVVDHPSAGEIYFPRSAMPFAAAASAWVVVSALRGRARLTHAIVVVAGLTLGTLLVVFASQYKPPPRGSRENRIGALGVPMAVLVGACLALVIVWMLARWRLRVIRGLGAGFAVMTLIGLSVPSAWATLRYIGDYGWPAERVSKVAADQVHPDEQRAALWLKANSRPQDVVATNTACHPARRQPPCDARGYIVSGIAGRETVLEGWAYTQQALARQGVDGKSYHYQPSPWPDRAGIIDRLFTAPNREIIETLRTTYGVRWIYADQLAGKVPVNTLGKLAVLRHEEPSVLIYELVPPQRQAVAGGR